MRHPALRIEHLLIFALACAATLPSSESFAEPTTSVLLQQLRAGQVRARVAAALQLGKHKQESTRAALEAALGDPIAQVRAAAAAALQRLADRRAVPKLVPLLEDESPAVRRQAASAIEALKAAPAPELVDVEVGAVRRAPGIDDAALTPLIVATAKDTLRRLPGVRVSRDQAPRLLLEGQLLRLEGKAEKNAYTVSARVEFVITKMPNRLIHGRVAGAATAYGDVDVRERPGALRELRRQAVRAATQSALADASLAFRPQD